jgi:hypothetical protein
MLQAPDKWVIEFSGCTGFGDVGRTCAIVLPTGDKVGYGNGASDADALIDALCFEGWTFDRAFDQAPAILKSATVAYHGCEPI